MTATTLDPNTALIIVDLQNSVVGMAAAMAHSVDDVVTRAAALADAFRRHHLPVVLVNVVGAPPGRTDAGRRALSEQPDDWADLVPALNRQPDDILITKRAKGAFSKTGLAETLAELGVTQVVVCGIATSVGVESTARAAHELGFNVTVAIDAMTDRSDDAHRHSIEQVFPRVAEAGTTAEILELLDRTRS
ncbi:MAG TPA: isochorismatase family protein [Microbacteriaceae bacterium]